MVDRTPALTTLLVLVGAVAACGDVPRGGYEPNTMVPGPTLVPPDAGAQLHGHYRGVAAIGEASYRYHAQGVITLDGQVRIHFGGPLSSVEGLTSGGGVPAGAFTPDEAFQLVGTLDWLANRGSGTGVVLAERCSSASARFCAAPAAAEISLVAADRTLAGEIAVSAAHGVEHWLLEIDYWSLYYHSLGAAHLAAGSRVERLAPFAEASAPVVTVDKAGRLFFQSPSFGCTGNGVLTPHPGGNAIFDVELVVENCISSHAESNGRFEGLAVETQNGFWSYDNWLLMLLSTRGSAPRALTMLGADEP